MNDDKDTEQSNIHPINEEVASQNATESGESESEEPNLEQSEGASDAEETIRTLQQQVAKLEDGLLRSRADMENIRRRSAKDVQDARKYASSRLIESLLPVIDSLDRAILEMESNNDSDSDGAVDDSIVQGVQLSLRLFMDTLGKFDVKQVNPEGEAFNPAFHEAVSMLPDDTKKPGTVITVLRKGYMLSDRVLRSAEVVVSKLPDTPPDMGKLV